MPLWHFVRDIECARGKTVHVRLDMHAHAPANYAVLLSYKQQIYAGWTCLTEAEADSCAEEQRHLAGPGGDGNWNAVWDRLAGKEKEVPWQGSTAESASQYFDVGTWNWIVHLADLREALAARKHSGDS